MSVTPDTTRPRKSRCMGGRNRLCVRHGQTQNAPPGLESAGGAVGWAMSRPSVLDRTRGLSAPAVLVLGYAAVPALRCGGCRVGRLYIQTESPSSEQRAHFGYARLSRPRGHEAGDGTVRRTRHVRPAGPRPNTRPRRTNLLVSWSAKVVRLPGRSRHAAEQHRHVHTTRERKGRTHTVAPPMFAATTHAAEMTRTTRGTLHSHRDATP